MMLPFASSQWKQTVPSAPLSSLHTTAPGLPPLAGGADGSQPFLSTAPLASTHTKHMVLPSRSCLVQVTSPPAAGGPFPPGSLPGLPLPSGGTSTPHPGALSFAGMVPAFASGVSVCGFFAPLSAPAAASSPPLEPQPDTARAS